MCANIVEEDLYEDTEMTYRIGGKNDLPSPAEIKEILDNYVIGQDEAKRTLAVAVIIIINVLIVKRIRTMLSFKRAMCCF